MPIYIVEFRKDLKDDEIEELNDEYFLLKEMEGK